MATPATGSCPGIGLALGEAGGEGAKTETGRLALAGCEALATGSPMNVVPPTRATSERLSLCSNKIKIMYIIVLFIIYLLTFFQ
jgi:hypothetical protein